MADLKIPVAPHRTGPGQVVGCRRVRADAAGKFIEQGLSLDTLSNVAAVNKEISACRQACTPPCDLRAMFFKRLHGNRIVTDRDPPRVTVSDEVNCRYVQAASKCGRDLRKTVLARIQDKHLDISPNAIEQLLNPVQTPIDKQNLAGALGSCGRIGKGRELSRRIGQISVANSLDVCYCLVGSERRCARRNAR